MTDGGISYSFGQATTSTRLSSKRTFLRNSTIVCLIISNDDNMSGTCLPPLHLASSTGDSQKIRELLAASPSSRLDDFQRTALHYCINAEVADLLIQASDDDIVNVRDMYGSTPLHEACRRARYDVVRRFLQEANIQIDLQDEAGNSCLHISTCALVSKALLEAGAAVDISNNAGDTALSIAAAKGLHETVSALLAAGASADHLNKKGRTPLMNASENGHEHVIDLLLELGKADVNTKDNAGWSALHFAALGAWPLHETHASALQRLIEAGASVDSADSMGWTPAHVSTDACGLRILINAGASLDAVDCDGRAAVHYQGADGVAELAKYGADILARDRYGRTAMHLCTGPDKVFVLHALGVGLNDLDDTGKTPLDWSRTRSDVEAALLQLGAQPSSSTPPPTSSYCTIL